MNQDEAAALWQLWQGLNPAWLVETIIDERAWEPLGYASFSAAWKAQMADVTLAPESYAHVVDQMLAEGAGVDDIAAWVKGADRDRVGSLLRERTGGLAAGPPSHRSVEPQQL